MRRLYCTRCPGYCAATVRLPNSPAVRVACPAYSLLCAPLHQTVGVTPAGTGHTSLCALSYLATTIITSLFSFVGNRPTFVKQKGMKAEYIDHAPRGTPKHSARSGRHEAEPCSLFQWTLICFALDWARQAVGIQLELSLCVGTFYCHQPSPGHSQAESLFSVLRCTVK